MEQQNGVRGVPYVVANYGKTPAIIGQAVVGVVWATNGVLPDPALVGDDSPLVSAPFIAAGDRLPLFEPIPPALMLSGGVHVVFDNPDDPDSPAKSYPALGNGPQGVFFRAVISYGGPLTRGHETACLWRYMGNGSFAPRGIAPEHHYQR